MGFSFVNSSLYYLNKKRNFCNVSGVWTSENGTRFLVGSTSWNGSWSFRFYLKLKYQTGMYLMLISKYSKKDNLLKFIDQPRRNHRKHFWHRAHQNVKILSSNLRFGEILLKQRATKLGVASFYGWTIDSICFWEVSSPV